MKDSIGKLNYGILGIRDILSHIKIFLNDRLSKLVNKTKSLWIFFHAN